MPDKLFLLDNYANYGVLHLIAEIRKGVLIRHAELMPAWAKPIIARAQQFGMKEVGKITDLTIDEIRQKYKSKGSQENQ